MLNAPTYPSSRPRRRLARTVLTVTVGVGLLLLAPGAATALHCPGDVDDDFNVGVDDLLFLLACWGPVTDPACADADFDGDGLVGCFDDEYLRGNWGPCDCPGDLNGDGAVDELDRQVLLGNFGNDCRFDVDEDTAVGDNDVDACNCVWGTASAVCDFDGDGIVDVNDLLALLAAIPTDCRGDLDHDGDVDRDDLQIFDSGPFPCP